MTKRYKKYIIFDFGASKGRALLARFDGSRFSLELIHRFDNEPVLAAGTLYWDILRLYYELKKGIQLSFKKSGDITSLAVNAWGADFGLIDKNGKLISNVVCYRDSRRYIDADKLYKIISREKLFKLTGLVIYPLLDLFHLFSLKIQNAVELSGETKYLAVPDIFNYFLTGKTYSEYSRATMSVMFSQKKCTWEEKILNKLGIPKDIFPELIFPGNRIGTITRELSMELDIPPVEIVAPLTHDTASAAAGIPVISRKKDWAFVGLGSWCVIGKETNSPVITGEVFKNDFSNEGSTEGKNILVRNITGLWIIQQCRNKWSESGKKEIGWDEIVRLSIKAKQGRSFIDVDNQMLSQPQADMPGVIKTLCQETGQEISESIGGLSRCIYESIVMKIRFYFEILEKITETKIEELYLFGGGIKNRMLCQWVADALGVVVITGSSESTSIGNLLMQLIASGEIKDLSQGRMLVANSVKISRYEPEDNNKWNKTYKDYLKIFNIKGDS